MWSRIIITSCIFKMAICRCCSKQNLIWFRTEFLCVCAWKLGVPHDRYLPAAISRYEITMIGPTAVNHRSDGLLSCCDAHAFHERPVFQMAPLQFNFHNQSQLDYNEFDDTHPVDLAKSNWLISSQLATWSKHRNFVTIFPFSLWARQQVVVQIFNGNEKI